MLRTADKPARIELLPDVTEVSPGGRDISQVEFRIVDAQGARVPTTDPVVTFEIDGPARVLGIGNGDLNSVEDCKDLVHRAYQGRGLAILEATGAAGNITLKASSPGLEPATVTISAGLAAKLRRSFAAGLSWTGEEDTGINRRGRPAARGRAAARRGPAGLAAPAPPPTLRARSGWSGRS